MSLHLKEDRPEISNQISKNHVPHNTLPSSLYHELFYLTSETQIKPVLAMMVSPTAPALTPMVLELNIPHVSSQPTISDRKTLASIPWKLKEPSFRIRMMLLRY
jgi:hypothetical protein